jgi:hypothetical protein
MRWATVSITTYTLACVGVPARHAACSRVVSAVAVIVPAATCSVIFYESDVGTIIISAAASYGLVVPLPAWHWPGLLCPLSLSNDFTIW